MKRVAMGFVVVVLPLAVAGAALADGFSLNLDQPSYTASQSIVVSWSGFPAGHSGEIWIDPASKPADPNAPASNSQFISGPSGSTQFAAMPPGSYEVRAEDLSTYPAQFVGTADFTVGGATSPGSSNPGPSNPAPSTPGPINSGTGSPSKARSVAAGRYGCYTSGVGGVLIRSSIGRLSISSSKRYRALGKAGSYRFTVSSQRLRMTSGPLRNRVAHYVTSPKRAIVFRRAENLSHGKPTIDNSTTYCYFGRA